METFGQPDSGYPEEQPPAGDEPGESEVRERSRPDTESERAPDNDDGTATGDPRSYASPSASYSRRKPSNRRRWPSSSRRMSMTMSCVTGSMPSVNSMMLL